MKYDFSEYNYLIPAHNANKDILKNFDVLCKENGWKYYLAYGTLLGAARHKDCIPWDDDIDVTMPRVYYEKLIKHYINNGIPGYKVSCYETDNIGKNLFIKFVDLNSSEKLLKFQTHPEGMSIDIFPLDEAYGSEDPRQIKKNIIIDIYRLAISAKSRLINKSYKDTMFGRIKKKAYLLMFFGKTLDELIEKTIKLCKECDSNDHAYYVNYCSPYSRKKEINPKSFWDATIYLQLGDSKYPAPAEYKKILSRVYGETWNEIPPNKLRYQHSEYAHNFWN